MPRPHARRLFACLHGFCRHADLPLISFRLFCCDDINYRSGPRKHPYCRIAHTARMITRFLTSVSTAFSPFNPKSGKTARNFLALLPPNARSTMKIDIKQLSKADANKPALLALKFSNAFSYPLLICCTLTRNHRGRQRDESRLGYLEDQGHHD